MLQDAMFRYIPHMFQQIPVSVISHEMGHDPETTTLTYPASLVATAIDRANRRMLSEL